MRIEGHYKISVFEITPFNIMVSATRGKYRVDIPVWMPLEKHVVEAKHLAVMKLANYFNQN